jgi:hypothetical protein
MPRPGLAYDRPSRGSQALIVGFSLAVVVMAGWLVLMVMFSGDTTTGASDTADLPVAAPHVENLPATEQSSTARLLTPLPEAAPWPDPPAGASPAAARSPPPAAPLAPAASLATAAPSSAPAQVDSPTTAYAIASVAPTESSRAVVTDESATETTTETDPGEIVPLPLPRPRRTSSVPFPRPRPQIGDAAPPKERSIFDFFVNRQQ